jgi:hypothetical protein
MAELRYAILIASSSYPKEPRLEALRCPENDVDSLNELLASKEYGGFNETSVLKNRPHYEVLLKINQVLKRATKEDLVLLYYSGHGKLDPAGRLHLTTVDTEVDSLEATSIPVESIRNYTDISASAKIVLILDCCYSGAIGPAFLRGGGPDDQLQRISRARGTYILTASTEIQVAQEKEGDQYGLLTKHILEGIRGGGASNEKGLVTMDTLYRYVFDQVRKESFQEPMKWDLNVRGDELVIARANRDPRDYRRKKIRAKLSEIEDSLPHDIFIKALTLTKVQPEEPSENDHLYNNLLDQLIQQQLTLGKFIQEWSRTESFSPSRSLELRISPQLKEPTSTVSSLSPVLDRQEDVRPLSSDASKASITPDFQTECGPHEPLGAIVVVEEDSPSGPVGQENTASARSIEGEVGNDRDEKCPSGPAGQENTVSASSIEGEVGNDPDDENSLVRSKDGQPEPVSTVLDQRIVGVGEDTVSILTQRPVRRSRLILMTASAILVSIFVLAWILFNRVSLVEGGGIDS